MVAGAHGGTVFVGRRPGDAAVGFTPRRRTPLKAVRVTR
jgi:hypothetical protein